MKIHRALRLAGWNVLFLVAGLALIGVVGEMYFRLRATFAENIHPHVWSPTVGGIYKPNAEVRQTNGLDFWTESRTNILGFVDREPIGLERAAASCHIAMLGDSYVEALQVPVADKFQVRLEELAAKELRHLDITTSAFGISGTGQVSQLAYYDEIRAVSAARPAGARLREQRLRGQCANLEGLAPRSGPGPTLECLRDTGRGWEHHAALAPSSFSGVPVGYHGLDFSALVFARHGPPGRHIRPRELAGCQEARFVRGRH